MDVTKTYIKATYINQNHKGDKNKRRKLGSGETVQGRGGRVNVHVTKAYINAMPNNTKEKRRTV